MKKISIFTGKVSLYIPAIFFVGVFLIFIDSVEAATNVKIGIPASFEAKVIPGASYEWTFPGGLKKTGKDVQFTFEEPGETSITLKVNKDGNTETITKQVFVQNLEKPTAIAKVTVDGKDFYKGTVPFSRDQSITFTSESISTGGSANDLMETWSIDGKTQSNTTLPNTLTEARLYPVKLIVSKKGVPNVRDEVLFQIDVRNLVPKIENITIQNNSKNSGKQVKISAQANDKDGEIEQYRFEILELGKVVLAQVTDKDSATFNLQQFPGKHEYTVKVTVQDNDKSEVTKTNDTPILIESDYQNTAPKVTLKVTPGNTGTTKTTFSFTADATDEDGDALRYHWTLPNQIKKTTRSFDHTFVTTGTKKISLTVTDGIETVIKEIEIEIRPESENKNQPPRVNIRGVWPSTTGNTETIFKFYADLSDEDNDAVTPIWEFEKRKTSNVLNAAHRFEKPGKYTVKLIGSDGEFEVTDDITITVVAVGDAIPESEDKRIIENEVEGGQDLTVKIASTNGIIKNCDPFDPTLKKILLSEKRSRQKILDTNPNISKKTRENLKVVINLINEKITLLEDNPFAVREEFNNGKIAELISQRDKKVEAFKAETRNKDKRNQIQAEILVLSKEIRRRELGISKEILIENILISAQKNREASLKKTVDKQRIKTLTAEIKLIEDQIAKLQNSPFVSRTEETKTCLLQLKEKLADPEKIEKVEKQIDNIETNPDSEDSKFTFADIIATTDTKLFFYGQAPKNLKQALYFEWELGKDIHVPGQNISLRYKKTGFYQVKLIVRGGKQEVSDTITIKIVENKK